MIYVTNEHKHYFAVSDDAWGCYFDSCYLQRFGCEIHLTQQAMYEHLVNEYGYTLDQVEGHEISIFLNDKGELVESFGANMQSVVDEDADDYNDWLVGFRL